jgi:excisionase family DNA binding protein
MEIQNANPFSLLDSRLKSIESTLAIIAAKEQPQPEKKYYTIAEAATKLNVAQITLYRNGQAGKIPTKKIGSRLMIPGSFVDSK